MAWEHILPDGDIDLERLDPDVARVVASPQAAGVRGYLALRMLVLFLPDASELNRDEMAELFTAVTFQPAASPMAPPEYAERAALHMLLSESTIPEFWPTPCRSGAPTLTTVPSRLLGCAS